MNPKARLLTTDHNIQSDSNSFLDRQLLNISPGDQGLIQITSIEQLKEMAKQAHETYRAFDLLIRPLMNKDRALLVKDLYQKEKYSYRALAIRCWTVWNGTWHPPSNQLAGMKICEIASEILKEKIDQGTVQLL